MLEARNAARGGGLLSLLIAGALALSIAPFATACADEPAAEGGGGAAATANDQFEITVVEDLYKATAVVTPLTVSRGETVTVAVTRDPYTKWDVFPVLETTSGLKSDWDGTGQTISCTIDGIDQNATVTITGRAVGNKIEIASGGLKHASATLSKTEDIADNETVTLTITPDEGLGFLTAPTVEAAGSTVKVGALRPQLDGTYKCDLTRLTDDATVTVSGEAVAGYHVTLDTSGLKGATVQLSAQDVWPSRASITVLIRAEKGKKWVAAPKVTATNGVVGEVAETVEGTYRCTVGQITGNTTIAVTGLADNSNPEKPDITINGNGTHLVGSGGTLTVTCSLPLENLVDVLVDGKSVDPANYDAASGSTIVTLRAAYLDTLSVGSHTLTLAYMDDRSAAIEFSVAKELPKPTGGDSKLAKTGDPLDAAPLVCVAAAAGVALVGAALRTRRAKR